MKRLLLAVTMLILGLTGLRQAEAGGNVSIDFFYDNIGSDGAWVELDDHGYCWQPTIAVSNAKWRPYSDGYWVYTDVGWTWVSYEDFGWATYHYGRWLRLRDRGWFWVPGREWGPAWVSWRTGGDYVGWAPLPPRGRGEVEYDNRPIHGQVDVEFDIGPSYYNFVEVRYIGEPVLRERIFESSMNVTYISTTVNVTNITYTNSVVYNHGPDYDTVSRYSMRPVRRMRLEREANADLTVAARSNSLLKVQGDRLVVAAPAMFEKPAKQIAPKVVKEKIAKPTVERGWDVVADPKAQAEMKEKMKKEDPKNVPPPSMKPNENPPAAQTPGAAAPGATAPGTMPAAGASPVMPSDQDKGKDKRLESATPMPAAPGSSPGTTPPAKSRKEAGDKPAVIPPPTAPGNTNTPAPAPAKPSERQRTAPSSLTTSPDGTPIREPEKQDQEAKKEKQSEKSPNAVPPTRQPNEPKAEKPPRQPKAETPDTMPPTRQPTAPPTEKAPRKPKTEPTQAPSTRQPEAQAKPPVPPPQMAPPKREAPPEAPPKQAPPDMSKARTAPPPPPAANPPVKAEPPPSKGGDKKGKDPAPSPGP